MFIYVLKTQKNIASVFRAVYCIIGSCDTQDDHRDVASKIDDYLWMKLNQVQWDSLPSTHGEEATLPHLQKLMLEEYGK